MKITVKSFLFTAVVAAYLAVGCTPYKDIVYFTDIDQVTLDKLTSEYEAIIKKDDRLTIVVSGPDKTVTAPYNLTLGEMTGTGTSQNPENTTLSYLVDVDGNIEFPILGKIHVEGMTRSQLVDYLTKEIGKDVQNPIVYVSFRNYKVTVLGEVRTPGTYTFDSEKISILQALGRAGDLNLTAERKGILLIREVDGVETHYKIDLRDSHLLDSPYFFLQQNDVIYVPASPSRVKTATTPIQLVSFGLSLLTSTLAIVTTVLALTKK